MSLPRDFHCGCNSPHAITKTQRAYAKRALQVAYSTRNRGAIAHIKYALSRCTSTVSVERENAKADFARIATQTLIAAHERTLKV